MCSLIWNEKDLKNHEIPTTTKEYSFCLKNNRDK